VQGAPPPFVSMRQRRRWGSLGLDSPIIDSFLGHPLRRATGRLEGCVPGVRARRRGEGARVLKSAFTGQQPHQLFHASTYYRVMFHVSSMPSCPDVLSSSKVQKSKSCCSFLNSNKMFARVILPIRARPIQQNNIKKAQTKKDRSQSVQSKHNVLLSGCTTEEKLATRRLMQQARCQKHFCYFMLRKLCTKLQAVRQSTFTNVVCFCSLTERVPNILPKHCMAFVVRKKWIEVEK
jgi:hypothetical protein